MISKKTNKKITLGQYYTSSDVANFMIDLSDKSKSSKVLESGFGNGVFIESLLQKGFVDIKGYDIDEENCELVKKLFKNRVKIECSDYLQTPSSEKFDLIIGNPPYVHWNNIQKKIRNKLSEDTFWKSYSNGEWDLLYAFIIWSVEKLNNEGELIYIVPYNWFNSTNASSLRQYLVEKGEFEIICHFGELKLFRDCYPNNIIFKYRKTKMKNKKPIYISEYSATRGNISQILLDIKKDFKNINNPSYHSESENLRVYTSCQFGSEKFWYLATNREKKQLERIEKSSQMIKLSDYLDIGVGIVSGFDQAFRIEHSEIPSFSESEKKLLKSFVKSINCQRYFINSASYYIFADEIKTEDNLKKYPKIYDRLLKYRHELDSRYISKNKNWWNWATIRNEQLFIKSLDKPKIFVPCIDRNLKSRFSYTENQYLGSGDVLVIIPKQNLKEDLLYILAWLNSDVINFWYQIKGAHTGKRIRYTQSYVSQIPLRLIDWNNQKEIKIYESIIEKTKKLIKSKSSMEYEKEINYMISKLIL